jgi:hypothetical protein
MSSPVTNVFGDGSSDDDVNDERLFSELVSKTTTFFIAHVSTEMTIISIAICISEEKPCQFYKMSNDCCMNDDNDCSWSFHDDIIMLGVVPLYYTLLRVIMHCKPKLSRVIATLCLVITVSLVVILLLKNMSADQSQKENYKSNALAGTVMFAAAFGEVWMFYHKLGLHIDVLMESLLSSGIKAIRVYSVVAIILSIISADAQMLVMYILITQSAMSDERSIVTSLSVLVVFERIPHLSKWAVEGKLKRHRT